MSWLYPKHRAFITERLASAPRGTLDPSKAAIYGRLVANALIEKRQGDDVFDERHPSQPVYLAPPPGMNAAGVLDPVNPVYKVHHEEVFKQGGSPTSSATTRTPEETVIGHFWAYDGAQKLGTPPRIYNRLVKAISRKYDLNEQQNVRLLTLVNVAMADAGIHAWFYKYHYDLWRPIVGIREYTKSYGPSAVPGATRLYLKSLNKITLGDDGSDNVAFDFLSEELDGMARDIDGSVRTRHVRSFASLLHAIVENAVSRVYLGVHWRFDGTLGGYDPDGSGSQPPTSVFDPQARPVAPRDHIGGVPLGLEIAEAIFTSGLKPSTASLAGGPPPAPVGPYSTGASGGKGGKPK